MQKVKRSLFKYHGFTLIELLVVISIIALIVGISLPNFLGARERSRDAKKKAELNQVKTALRLYYNDFNHYPAQSSEAMKTLVGMQGCGWYGNTPCAVPPQSTWCPGIDFSTGPEGGSSCETVYMKKFPSYAATLNYFSDGADNYRLSVILENPSDSDIAASQTRCPSALGASCTGNTYCVCPE